MKKKLLMLLAVSVFLIGCGKADTLETESGNDTKVQQTQKETEAVTEHICVYENYVSNNDATYLADGTETATCVCGLTDTRTAEGSKLEYTFEDLDKTMYAKQSVNVRDLPSTDGNKLGGLSHAQEVKVTGQCKETSWYRIEFESGVAYVSNSYLQNDKPAQQTATQGGTTNNTASTSSQNFPHALYSPWYDAATDNVYFYYVGQNWDENGTYATYKTACDLLDQYTTAVGVHSTSGSVFIGNYAEGEIRRIGVCIHPVN